MPYDLLIRNARLHRRSGAVDIAVQDGRFARIAPDLSQNAAGRAMDAGGRLVSPPFIDAHVHLDAALTVDQPRPNVSGTLLEGIQIWSERKPSLSRSSVVCSVSESDGNDSVPEPCVYSRSAEITSKPAVAPIP